MLVHEAGWLSLGGQGIFRVLSSRQGSSSESMVALLIFQLEACGNGGEVRKVPEGGVGGLVLENRGPGILIV